MQELKPMFKFLKWPGRTPAVHDIETQRTAHKRYMENATLPKKDILLLDADKVG